MKNLWKKLFVLFAAAVLALGVVACGKGKGTSRVGTNKLRISFVEAGYGRQWLVSWIDAYNAAHPDEPIEVELEGSSQMTGEIGTRLDAESNLSDIFIGLTTNWQSWAKKGQLEPLDDLYASEVDPGVTLTDFMVEGVRDFGKVGQNKYAIPLNDGAAGIAYNKTMFDARGWEVPTTVAELETLCNTISAAPGNIAPFSWSGQAMYWDFPVMTWWAQYEGVENFNNFYKFDSPEVFQQTGRVKALEVFQSLICRGNGTAKNSADGSMSKNHIEAQMAFIQGKAAMIPNGAWLEYEMRNNIEPGSIEIRMMPTPVIAGAKTGADGQPIKLNNTMAGDFIIIPKLAENKELAKKFLQFVHSDAMSKLYTQKCGAPRPFKYSVKDITDLSGFTRSCLDIWENSVGLYEISQSPLFQVNYVNKWPSYGQPYGVMITDNESPQTVVNTMYSYVQSQWSSWAAILG
ncbi:hypothetical protein FACS1894211_01220 [Clostridia bacterium]|nr:hypothetical protein FACS1894211_01220 [Clostridia bacterium]